MYQYLFWTKSAGHVTYVEMKVDCAHQQPPKINQHHQAWTKF